MNLTKILGCFLLLLCVISTSAQASDPTAIKIDTLQDPHGRTLIVERSLGSTILGPPPTNLQIRNYQGIVVAHSPTDSFVVSICPHIEFCYALPHSGFYTLSPVWKLDYQSVDFSAQKIPNACHDNVNSDLSHRAEAKELCEYLNNPEKLSVRNRAFNDPAYLKEPLNFSPAPPVMILISPFLVIMMNIHIFLGYFFMGGVIGLHKHWINKRILLTGQTTTEFIWKSIKIICLLLSIISVICLPAISSSLLGVPILYSYFFMIMGAFMCRKYSQNKNKEPAVQSAS